MRQCQQKNAVIYWKNLNQGILDKIFEGPFNLTYKITRIKNKVFVVVSRFYFSGIMMKFSFSEIFLSTVLVVMEK